MESSVNQETFPSWGRQGRGLRGWEEDVLSVKRIVNCFRNVCLELLQTTHTPGALSRAWISTALILRESVKQSQTSVIWGFSRFPWHDPQSSWMRLERTQHLKMLWNFFKHRSIPGSTDFCVPQGSGSLAVHNLFNCLLVVRMPRWNTLHIEGAVSTIIWSSFYELCGSLPREAGKAPKRTLFEKSSFHFLSYLWDSI